MPDIQHLGDALDLLEALLVGSVALGLAAPDPLLGIGIGVDVTKSITVVDGLFLSRPLDNSDFLVDKRLVVKAPTTVNTGRSMQRDFDIADDTVITELDVQLPLTDNTTAQTAARNGALKLDNDIRGRFFMDDVEGLGLKFLWVNSTHRIALDSGSAGTAGYGSARHIVVTSTYKMTRIESLTGGPE